MHDVRGQKFGVIVEPGRQVEALVAGPVAVARQPDQRYDPFRGLPGIGLKPFYVGVLRQIVW
jgi:hypothetical protein